MCLALKPCQPSEDQVYWTEHLQTGYAQTTNRLNNQRSHSEGGTVEIRDKSDHDPVADLNIVDAYMCWALLASEEVVGKRGLATALSSKLLPVPMQLKIGLTSMQNGFRKLSQEVGQEVRLSLEDRGDRLAYVDMDCSQCAGKEADTQICTIRTGTLQAALAWLTGKEFDVQEVACRAMGDPACVWEIDKTPKA